MALPGMESKGFRRATGDKRHVTEKSKDVQLDRFGVRSPQGWKKRHQGLLQDKVGR